MITPELHARASDLFNELRTLDPSERARRLAAVEDAALRDEVASLLRYADDPSPADPAGQPETPPEAPDFAPGSALGPYTIVRRLGRGATGLVVLAEQSEPVRRRVAIKFVPHAILDPALAARFEFERHALEQTDHPGIPRPLDAGRTDRGMPYLVMEFVDGEPITAYARRHALSLPARVTLIADAAAAVQHAHQRGLIHRDLKPANVLVQGPPEAPVAKIVDFGIARAVNRAEDHTLTAGWPIGTLAYMAPEQATGVGVDTRADVYGLGAVLYELLTGQPPVDTRAPDPFERLRAADPVPPSRHPGVANALPGARAARPMLADLDRVLARALDKAPARRYPTAEAFAADLQRVLRREPVEARPRTPVYRLARFAQRHRALTAAVAVAAVAVVVGIAGLTAGLVESRRQQRVAAERADTLAAFNRFLLDDLLAATSPDENPIDTPAVALLDRAAGRIDARFPDRPLLAANLHHALGAAYRELGAFEPAETHFARAEELRARHAGPDAPDTLRTRLAAAALLVHRQRPEEGIPLFETLLPAAALAIGPDDPDLLAAHNDFALALVAVGRAPEALDHMHAALEGRRRVLGPHDPLTLVSLANLAYIHDALGQTDAAIETTAEALRIAESLPDPPRTLLLGLHNNLGATYQDLGRHAEARPHLETAARLAEGWLGPDHPDTLTLLANLAALQTRLGDPAAAEAALARIVAARAATIGPDAHDTLAARHALYTARMALPDPAAAAEGFRALLDDCRAALGPDHWLTAASGLSLATALEALGSNAEAARHAEEARRVFESAFGPDHPRTVAARRLVERLAEPHPDGPDAAQP